MSRAGLTNVYVLKVPLDEEGIESLSLFPKIVGYLLLLKDSASQSNFNVEHQLRSTCSTCALSRPTADLLNQKLRVRAQQVTVKQVLQVILTHAKIGEIPT